MGDFALLVMQNSPAGEFKVTEIGWWCEDTGEDANWEAGIYEDNFSHPYTLLSGESKTNAKGITAGWKRATGLNITISASTNYWIAIQIDDTISTIVTNRGAVVGMQRGAWAGTTTLPTTGSTLDWENSDYGAPIYALYEESSTEPTVSGISNIQGVNTITI